MGQMAVRDKPVGYPSVRLHSLVDVRSVVAHVAVADDGNELPHEELAGGWCMFRALVHSCTFSFAGVDPWGRLGEGHRLERMVSMDRERVVDGEPSDSAQFFLMKKQARPAR